MSIKSSLSSSTHQGHVQFGFLHNWGPAKAFPSNITIPGIEIEKLVLWEFSDDSQLRKPLNEEVESPRMNFRSVC
jgi:hypothetical protein